MSLRVESYKIVGRKFFDRFFFKVLISLKTVLVNTGVVFEEMQF